MDRLAAIAGPILPAPWSSARPSSSEALDVADRTRDCNCLVLERRHYGLKKVERAELRAAMKAAAVLIWSDRGLMTWGLKAEAFWAKVLAAKANSTAAGAGAPGGGGPGDTASEPSTDSRP